MEWFSLLAACSRTVMFCPMKPVLILPFVNGERYQSRSSLSYRNDCVNHAFGARVSRHRRPGGRELRWGLQICRQRFAASVMKHVLGWELVAVQAYCDADSGLDSDFGTL
jgi:hypothetical protein